MRIESAGCTDVGRRSNNEDAFRMEEELGVFVVADGLGGYEGGEVASRLTVDTFVEFYARSSLDPDVTWPFGVHPHLTLEENRARGAIGIAHRSVRSEKRGRLEGMASTVAALIVRPSEVVIAHVGDSRVYRLREGRFEAMTRDHSFVAEMLGDARVQGEEAQSLAARFGHMVTRAIGIGDVVEPDVRTLESRSGDLFLLCTDGVFGALEESEMVEILSMFAPSVACDLLVSRAIDAGSTDNSTAVAVRVV